MEYDFENALACSLQPWDQLENEEGENDKVFGGIWKVIGTKAGKIRVGKTEERRKEIKRERAEKEGKGKTKKRKGNGSIWQLKVCIVARLLEILPVFKNDSHYVFFSLIINLDYVTNSL